MPAHPKYHGLCLNHGTLSRRAANREDDLYNDMCIPAGESLTQEEIQRALARVFEALAANRISTRRAATLAYLGFLMQQSYSGLKAEARLTELQGFKDLRMLLKMKYGPPLRKEAEQRLAQSLKRSETGAEQPATSCPKPSTNPKST